MTGGRARMLIAGVVAAAVAALIGLPTQHRTALAQAGPTAAAGPSSADRSSPDRVGNLAGLRRGLRLTEAVPARPARIGRTAAAGTGAAGTGAGTGAGAVASAGGCPARPGVIMNAAPGTGRTVALTFDDGPGPFTGAVLDVLAHEGVHASFFLVGRHVAADPATARRIAAAGHLVGNHSWDHQFPRQVGGGWSIGYLRDQISRTDRVLAAVTGVRPCWFRPPGGYLQAVPGASRATGKQVAMWSVDTLDWKIQEGAGSDPGRHRQQQIARRAWAGANQPHPLILMHDDGGWRGATVGALPSVISYYRSRGFRFVRLDGRP